VSRRRTILAVTAVACLAAVLIAGCSPETRQKILPIFFDGFPPEGPKPLPPTRRARQDLLKEIEDLKRGLTEAAAAAKARQEGEHPETRPGEEPRKPIERAGSWREKILPIFFDGFSPEGPKPLPQTRRVRRDLLKEIEDLKRELAEARAAARARQEGEHPSAEPRKPIERARSWDEAMKLLPITLGAPDWAKALSDGVIAPRPGLDAKAADEPIFPLDVELVPADNPTFKVVFPHGTHTALLSCASCHPGIFQMAAGANPITMEKIFAGEYCGRCHGSVAFAVPTGCPRCHPVLAGGA
jgi:c(7)-type cytochrome triheme protein